MQIIWAAGRPGADFLVETYMFYICFICCMLILNIWWIYVTQNVPKCKVAVQIIWAAERPGADFLVEIYFFICSM